MIQSPTLVEQPRITRAFTRASITAIGGSFFMRACIAGLVTLAALQYSMRHGRLIQRPVADDATYFVDGLHRLQILYSGGIAALVRSLAVDPPHAPFSSLLAMASFALFGRHDWAPYAGNFVIVLAMLTAVDWLLGTVRPWQRALAYTLVLGTRWPWTGVTEFRPDIATGLAIAVAIIYCLKNPLLDSSFKHRLSAGALFGLAILLKPTLSPVNGVLFVCALLTAIAVDALIRRRRPRVREIFSTVWPVAAMALIVMLPYYALGWRVTWDYIYSNIWGSRKLIWHFNAGPNERFRYYLDYPNLGGDFVLGIGHVYLLIALVFVGLALVFSSNDRGRKFRSIGLLCIGLIAYAIPTLAKTKNLFFGAGFQTLLLLCGVLVLRQLLLIKNPLATVVALLACAASVSMFQMPVDRGNPWDFNIANSNRLLDQVYSAVQQGQIGDRIFVPAPGRTVSWNTMNYLSLSDDSLRRFINLDYGQATDRALIATELDQADWVVLGDIGNDEVRDLPNRQALPQYWEAVNQRGDFAEAARFPTGNGKFYHVLKRQTPAFNGLAEGATSGLRGVDGAHPYWRLPVTRAAIGPVTHIKIPDGAADRILVLSLLCRADHQMLTVLLDGEPIAKQNFEKSDEFQDMRVPLKVLPGEHQLEIQYGKSDNTGLNPTILYKKLQIQDAKP